MFSIGEFSRIARVSKRLLQFYDEEDLLHPIFTDPQTGYRKYSAQQLTTLNRVLALKEVGLSLADIRALLRRGVSQAEVKDILQQKQIELKENVQTVVRRLRVLEARLDDQENAPDVVIKSLPETVYLYRTRQLHSVAEAWPWVRATALELFPLLKRHGCSGDFSVQLPGDSFETENFTLRAGFALAKTPDFQTELRGQDRLAMELLPARPIVATVAQVGGPEMMYRGCGAIGCYIEKLGFQMMGAPREVILEIPPPQLCADAVIESQFEVRPA